MVDKDITTFFNDETLKLLQKQSSLHALIMCDTPECDSEYLHYYPIGLGYKKLCRECAVKLGLEW